MLNDSFLFIYFEKYGIEEINREGEIHIEEKKERKSKEEIIRRRKENVKKMDDRRFLIKVRKREKKGKKEGQQGDNGKWRWIRKEGTRKSKENNSTERKRER